MRIVARALRRTRAIRERRSGAHGVHLFELDARRFPIDAHVRMLQMEDLSVLIKLGRDVEAAVRAGVKAEVLRPRLAAVTEKAPLINSEGEAPKAAS